MPSRIDSPSFAAGPENAADWPNVIVVFVTPGVAATAECMAAITKLPTIVRVKKYRFMEHLSGKVVTQSIVGLFRCAERRGYVRATPTHGKGISLMVSIGAAFLADGRPFFNPDKLDQKKFCPDFRDPAAFRNLSRSKCITLVAAATFQGDLSSLRVTTADLD